VKRSHAILAFVLCLALAALAAGSLSAQVGPNDPEYGRQRYLSAIRAPEAWQSERGQPSVVLAVLSSGVEVDHPDLVRHIWQNPSPGSACRNDVNGCNVSGIPAGQSNCTLGAAVVLPSGDVRDDLGYGTALAGIAGALTNNGLGIAGVAWNVTLMPVKVSGCIPPTGSQYAAGIAYAVSHGANVILLGGDHEIGRGSCTAAPGVLVAAVRAALADGVVVIAGAGNSGADCADGAAAIPGVIAVAAADVESDRTRRPSFAQGGADVTLTAPGVRVVGTVPAMSCALCSSSGYRALDGSGPAAALTAGAAVLVLSRNPLLGPVEVRVLLSAAATPTGESWSGAGLLNVGRALALVPASYTGLVTRSPRDAETPVTVSAYVGTRRCGEAVARPRDGVTSYLLHVRPDAVTAGCGVPGADVSLRIDEAPAALVQWRSGAQTVNLTQADRISAQPAATVTPQPPPSAPPSPAVSPTPTPAPSATPSPTPTPTPSATPAPTPAPSAAASPTPEPTPTQTPTPIPTLEPTPTPGPQEAAPRTLAAPASLIGTASQSGALLAGIVLSGAIDDDFARPGAPLQRFRGAETQVVLWTSWTGQPGRHEIAFIWSRPDRSRYRDVELTDTCPCIAVTRWQLDWPGPNEGGRLLDAPGIWQIDIYADGELLGVVQFEIADS